MFDELQKAILVKDQDGVVRALSGLSEDEREALHEPLAVLFHAIGLDSRFVSFLHASVKPDDPVVLAKRQADGLKPMSQRDGNYDYEMSYVAWLASYGVVGREAYDFFLCVPGLEAESAQILADRRPPWFDEWLDDVTVAEDEQDQDNITASSWCRLYALGVVGTINEDWIRQAFAHELPHALKESPEATQQVLREVPAAVEAMYKVFDDEYSLFNAREWTDVVAFATKEGLLDHGRFLRLSMEALHRDLNQTERNGCIILARTVSRKAANCPPETIIELQPTWVSLLSDPQTAVAGFGLEQLVAVEKAGALDAVSAATEMPHIFQHKPKNHATKAIALLERCLSQQDCRSAALEALTAALSHTNKDVQAAALTVFEQQLKPTDAAVINQLLEHTEVVAATLQPQLQALIASLGGREDEAEAGDSDAADADLNSLFDLAGKLPADTRERFHVDQALEAARQHKLAFCGSWRMSEVLVLQHQPKLEPIGSVEELFEVTATAVERCESPDLPEQIVDGIVRFGRDRPPQFDALKEPLAKRACGWVMERPNRGIVGGVMGDAFSHLIRVWLEVEDDEDDDEENWFNDYYPMAGFLREVAERIQNGSVYPLLSTATHAGGWIDPDIWVARILEVEAAGIELSETDLIRSLLRLTPDGRAEAFQKMSDGQQSPSDRVQKLFGVVLDLQMPDDNIALDDSWSPFVWMAAIRSRDAWVDLEQKLPPDELAQIDPELLRLPDVLKPCDYRWQPKESANGRFMAADLVNSQPMPGEPPNQSPQDGDILKALLSGLEQSNEVEDLDQALERIGITPPPSDGGFLMAQLNRLSCYPAAAYIYPYLATQWPMKLDWYWNLATVGLSRRTESGSSVEERYDQFFLPLFEADRPLCRMAARALSLDRYHQQGQQRERYGV